MKIYGYEGEEGDLLSLQEITLQVDVSELKALAEFIEKTIGLMERYGDEFGHEHFSDFTGKDRLPDIIIAK